MFFHLTQYLSLPLNDHLVTSIVMNGFKPHHLVFPTQTLSLIGSTKAPHGRSFRELAIFPGISEGALYYPGPKDQQDQWDNGIRIFRGFTSSDVSTAVGHSQIPHAFWVITDLYLFAHFVVCNGEILTCLICPCLVHNDPVCTWSGLICHACLVLP